jgi:cytochrome c-type biogenesis protein CcmH/NrfF
MKRLAFLLPMILLATPVAAQKPPASGEAMSVHPEARKAIDALKSPYCPGLMLEVCPSPGGAMLRDSIQARAERGMKADVIVQGILDEYGEEWRAEPQRSGTGLWAWVIPPAVLLAGLGLVGLILAHRKRSANGAPPAAPVGAEEEERIRQALKELDEEEEPVF